MKKLLSISITVKIVFIYMLLLAFCNTAKATDPPFTVKTGLFDQTKTDNLGLSAAVGTETVTVFRPSDSTDHYGNGVVLTAFKGWLYCQWQSSAQNEDASDTWVAYSRSQDGKNWSAPMILSPRRTDGFSSSGGWWATADTLVAYINVWPTGVSPRGGLTYYTTSTDGLTWSALKQLPMANGTFLIGIFEQDPHALPDGRIIGAAHFQPGLIACPIYTDDHSGIRGWIRASYTDLSITNGTSQEMEPSWFWRSDGSVVMTFRDQNSSFYRLASVSVNRGQDWSTSVLTNMPDSRAKQSAGNLPDSTAYMVGNPVNNSVRIPLAIALSRDGNYFSKAFVLRQGGSDLQALRYTGTAKRAGYHYPKSMVWQGYLYVAYSTNKEDVEYTRIPLTSLSVPLESSTSVHNSLSLSEVPEVYTLYQNYPNPFNPTTRLQFTLEKNGSTALKIYNILGQKVATLFEGNAIAGKVYELEFNAIGLSGGLYFARLESDGKYQIRKLVFVK